MSIRSQSRLDPNVLTMAASGAVTAGRGVKITGARTVTQCGAGDRVDGVALSDAASGADVSFALADGSYVARCIVGTGGTTAGARVTAVANGLADVGVLGGGMTAVELAGIALDTCVVGDMASVLLQSQVMVKA